ncbi:hypothetical protein ACI79C_03930 [Geodermatophilus sp. SYSU D00697]
MRKRTLVATLGAAGALALTGIGVAVADPSPAPTPAPSTADADEGSSRREAIANALGGLVEDGTITQEQADAVAATLEDADVGPGWWHGGHHGWGGAWRAGLQTAAEALGMTTDELRDALSQEGTSLADVAAQQGVATQDLVDALTTAARERIDQAVAEGRLSREKADQILADLPDRIADAVARDSWSGGWWRHDDD